MAHPPKGTHSSLPSSGSEGNMRVPSAVHRMQRGAGGQNGFCFPPTCCTLAFNHCPRIILQHPLYAAARPLRDARSSASENVLQKWRCLYFLAQRKAFLSSAQRKVFCKDVIPLAQQTLNLLEFQRDSSNFLLDVPIKDLPERETERRGRLSEASATLTMLVLEKRQ